MEQSMIRFRLQDEPPLTEIELEVADFMDQLRLARLQPDPAPPRRLPYSWGFKRRRSAIDQSPPPPTAKKPKVVDAASSPATTLAFPPSESEERLFQQQQPPLKPTLSKLPKKIEELQGRYDSETIRNQTLSQELQKVRSHHDKLKEENIRLKEMLENQRQKRQLCLKLEPSMGFNHRQVPYIILNQQPLILEQTGRNGREEPFDLNVAPAEEAPPLDASMWRGKMAAQALKAAQARQNRFNYRKQKIQEKNDSAVAKSRAVR